MSLKIFEFSDYRKYLEACIHQRPKRGHGFRAVMAATMKCQPAYLSHVLKGKSDLSLEQADALHELLGHSSIEADYFMALVQRARAGTVSLRRYFSQQLELHKEQQLNLKNRLNHKETLRVEDQATYYSDWYYSAIHMALSIPKLCSPEALSKHFNLPLARIEQVLEFLKSVGLAVQKAGAYEIGTARIHLKKDSPLIRMHHSNWRLRALQSLEKESKMDLHFSSAFTVSADDMLKLREMLVSSIENSVTLIGDSRKERICALSLDFFELG